MSIYLVVEPLLYIKLFLLLQVYKVDVSDLNKDYVTWVPHENSQESGNIKGCLLGKKETFKKVKQDVWYALLIILFYHIC